MSESLSYRGVTHGGKRCYGSAKGQKVLSMEAKGAAGPQKGKRFQAWRQKVLRVRKRAKGSKHGGKRCCGSAKGQKVLSMEAKGAAGPQKGKRF